MQMLSEFQIAGSFVYGSMAFSSDGWLLATGSAGGAVQLWDPWVGEEVQDVGSHEHYVYTVGFGGDGRTLVSGGSDGIGYVWDLQPANLSPQADMTRLWNDLGADAATAYRAMWAMRQQPKESAEFLADRLKSVSTVIGRDQLADAQPDEAGNRQKRLLLLLAEKDDRVALYPTIQRAIVTLAQLHTPEASAALKDLAENATADEVSRLASNALRRLEIRP